MASLWTADSRTYVGANGSLVAHVYPDAVNYRDSAGEWKPVDNTLVVGGAGFVNAANRFRVELPSMLGLAPIRMSDGAQWVSFALDGAAGLPAVPLGSTATYVNALPGVNVSYTVTGAGLEESATLLDRSSPRSLRFTLAVSSGLTPVQAPDGSIAFDNARGQTQFSFLPPRLSDAAGADGVASYHLRKGRLDYEVTLAANAAWLASPHRAWPVTIDPSLRDDGYLYQSKNPMHPTVDGYIVSGTSASQNWFNLAYEKVGYNSSGKRRALLEFNPQGVLPKGAQVLNATLNMYLTNAATTTQAAVGVYSMTRAWTSGATWNTYDGTHGWGAGGGDFTTEPLQGTNPWATTTIGSTVNKYYSWDITQLVAGWESADVPSNGLMLKTTNDTVNNLFTFNSSSAGSNLPYAAVTYNLGIGDNGANTFSDFPIDDHMDAQVNDGDGNLLLCNSLVKMPGVNGFNLDLKMCWNSLGGDPNSSLDGQWLLAPGQTTYLDKVGTSVVYHADIGETEPFTPAVSGGGYIAPIGFDGVLTTTTGNLTRCSGSPAYTYVVAFDADGSKEYFNGYGQLMAKADKNNNAICFTYTGTPPDSRLATIVDTAGRTVNFAYNFWGQLTTITAPGNCGAGGGNGTCTINFGFTDTDQNPSPVYWVGDSTGATTYYSYDANGNLTSVKDPNGNTINFGLTTVNGGEAVSSVTQPANPGAPTTFTYTDTSQSFCGGKRTTDVTAPDGSVSYYCSDTGLRVNGIKAPDGSVSSTDYTDTSSGGSGCVDAYGDSLDDQPCSSTDNKGNVTTYTYSSGIPQDLTVEVAPPTPGYPSGETTTYTYTDLNHPYYPTAVTAPPLTNGNYSVTSYTYDAAGNTTNTTVKTYASNNSLLSTQVEGQFEYNGQTYNGQLQACGGTGYGQVCLSGDADNNWTGFTYTGSNSVASTTTGLNSSDACPGNDICPKTTFTYDSAGRILSEVAPLGNVTGNNPAYYTTAYTYDTDGRLLTTTDPLGHTTTFTYDADGNRQTITDPNGHTTTYTYDANDRLISVTDPLGNTSRLTYDADGNQLSHQTGLNSSGTCPTGDICPTTTYGFNSDDQLSSQTSPLGEETTYTYDPNGNLATTVDPRGNVQGGNPSAFTTTNAYTSTGQLASTTDALGDKTSYAYDQDGNQAAVTDANSHTTSYTYDGLGRVLTATAPDGGVTTYTYDGNGNVLTRTDANGHTTTYTYDNNGHLSTVTGPNPGTGAPVTTYRYDANGNLIQKIEPSGATVTYSYYTDNRLHTISYSDSTPSVSYTYDADGNRASMTDGAGTVSYTYDADNHLLTATRGSDTFTYTYDNNGELTSRAYPGGTTTSYSYDADQELASATSNNNTTSYGYDPAGNLLTTALPNGYVAARAYDAANRVTDVNNARNGTVLSDYAYTYNPVGNRTKVVQMGAVSSTTTYAYDQNNRLTDVCYQLSCNESQGSQDPYVHYTYDHVGNRLTQTTPSGTTTYAYNPADELTSAGSITYAYDANGNQTAAGNRTFAYNAANQLISTTNNSATTTYTYDGDGNRLSGVGGGTATNFVWDINNQLPQLALERDGNNSIVDTYTYGMGRISMATGGNPYYYLYDAQGSVVNLTSAVGATEWTYAYDPWGNARTQTENDPNAPANAMQFTGELYDASSGLYDLRARQYDPTSGRFLSPDPLAGAVSSNLLYAYASDDPVLLIDPSGLCSWDPFSSDFCPDVWAAEAADWVGREIYDHVIIPGWNLTKSAFHNAVHAVGRVLAQIAPYCTACLNGAVAAGVLMIWTAEGDIGAMAFGCWMSALQYNLQQLHQNKLAELVSIVGDATDLDAAMEELVKTAEKHGAKKIWQVLVRRIAGEGSSKIVVVYEPKP